MSVAPALDRRLSIGPPHPHLYAAALAFYLVLLVVALGLAGAYRRPLAWTGPGEYRAVVQAVTFTLLTLVMATYFVDHANRISRGWLLATWVLACTLVMGTRLLARLLAGRLAAAGVVGRRVLVVGTHPDALAMEWLLRRQPHLGLRVAGFVDDDDFKRGKLISGQPVFGSIDDLEHVRRRGVHRLIELHRRQHPHELAGSTAAEPAERCDVVVGVR